MGPQQYVFVLLLVALARLTGLTTLQLAQPAIAFIGLEALSYQGTTTEAEFSAATFASTVITEPWTSDDHIICVGSNDYDSEYNQDLDPIYDWLYGGDPPACTTVAEDSWTTVGAQLFPASPEQGDEEAYQSSIWLAGRVDFRP